MQLFSPNSFQNFFAEKEIQCVENGENNGTEHGNKRKRKRHRKNDGDFNSRPKVRKSTLLEKVILMFNDEA